MNLNIISVGRIIGIINKIVLATTEISQTMSKIKYLDTIRIIKT